MISHFAFDRIPSWSNTALPRQRGLAGIGAVIVLFIVRPPVWGQWSTGSSGAIYYNGGNVGIGTSTPSGGALNVIAPYYNSGILIQGSSTCGSGIEVSNTAANGHAYAIFAAGSCDGVGAGGFGIFDDTVGAYRFAITSSGDVGIGTMSPQHLLHVAGTIGAEEIIVSSTGADYVFEPNYRLQPLGEVAKYISENHHLPDVPSADEVKKSGMSVGDMEAKLLAKIEELTLHMIDAEERSKALENRNQELQRRLDRLETQNRQIAQNPDPNATRVPNGGERQ